MVSSAIASSVLIGHLVSAYVVLRLAAGEGAGQVQ
jgi:hypothetical protein